MKKLGTVAILVLSFFFLTASSVLAQTNAQRRTTCVQACPAGNGAAACVANCYQLYPQNQNNTPIENRAAEGLWQGTPIDPTLPLYQKQVEEQQQKGGAYEWMSQVTFNYLALAITNKIAGSPVTGPNGNVTGYRGGAINLFASLTGTMYANKPASTGQYVQYLAQNAGFPNLVPVAYAQSGGIGFQGLNPILQIWQVVRNLAYLAFAVIFVIIGLMIMLRVKIDPKTVVSIQNALPKIFLSLILITFSYPIAGFLIDLMYVLIGVIISLFAGAFGSFDVTGFRQNIQYKTIFEFVGTNLFIMPSFQSGKSINDIIVALTGNIPGVSNLFGFVGGVIGGLIISLAILYALFRTWLMLLGAYINIIIGVILSPLAMLADAIPGQSGFSAWLRSMLSNLLQFPLVITLLLFGGGLVSMSNQFQPSQNPGGPFVPPLIGGSDPNAIPALIGIGILLMIPKAGAMLQEWLKSPPFKHGMAWAEAVGWAYSPYAGGLLGQPRGREAAAQAERGGLPRGIWDRLSPLPGAAATAASGALARRRSPTGGSPSATTP